MYYFGLIDILTNFNTKKKIEYAFKWMAYGPTISAIPPREYKIRFDNFIENMFDESVRIPDENLSPSMVIPNKNGNQNNINIDQMEIY